MVISRLYFKVIVDSDFEIESKYHHKTVVLLLTAMLFLVSCMASLLKSGIRKKLGLTHGFGKSKSKI